jgi:hypothetical protein
MWGSGKCGPKKTYKVLGVQLYVCIQDIVVNRNMKLKLKK